MDHKKEDRLMNKLKDPDEKEDVNGKICSLINKTLKSGHKVYLSTDWHLWLREEKDKPQCHKRSDFNTILNNMRAVKPDDLLIYMGDLVDGEFQNKNELKEALQSLSGLNMIMVRGNNDLFDKSFYKSCGFQYVVDSFVWNDIIFTHVPVKNDHNLNVHGHTHNYKTYRIPYTNQIDVAYLDGRKTPAELQKVIAAQPKYSKLIKEQPEYFEESFDLFESINHRVEDPYHDEEAYNHDVYA